MPPRARILAASVLVASLITAGPPPAAGAGMTLKRSWKVGIGVKLHKYVNSVPTKAFVLEIDPTPEGYNSARYTTVDVAMPGPTMPGTALTSAMGADHGALGAINGDLGVGKGCCRPQHPFAMDANLWQSGIRVGGSFAVRRDETAGVVDRAKVRITATGPDGTPTKVDRWNSGKPKPGEIAAFSPEGGSAETPPASGCSVRLVNPTGRTWTTDQSAIKRTYAVDAVQCPHSSAMARQGGVVLSTTTDASPARSWINALSGAVTVKWSLGPSFAGVADSMGGWPILLQNGVDMTPGTSCATNRIFCRNNRTGVGYDRETGHVFFVVVDGRQSSWSRGMTMTDFTAFFQQLGVDDALNLDGGGSATLWVKRKRSRYCQIYRTVGCIVNRPTTNGSTIVERKVENALLVLPRRDRAEKVS